MKKGALHKRIKTFKYPDLKIYLLRVRLGVSSCKILLLDIKMKSKTKINKQLRKKRNPFLVDTIIDTRKNDKWMRVSEILSSPRKNKLEKNLDTINKESKEGDTIVIPGKVLSVGELNKKIKVVAFSFSENAKNKILKSGGKISTIVEEIKKNPKAEGVKILE